MEVFTSPGDIAFNVLSFPVYYYGIVMAFACLVGVFTSFLFFQASNKSEISEKIWDFSIWILIFGFLGARLYYCILNPVYYFSNPWDILNFREGGLSVHGAIIGGILAIFWLSKKHNIRSLKLLDAYSCGLALAQSIGRWGNFFNSEAFGLPTDLPWKLFIPYSHRPENFRQYDYFHPTFLYESIADFCIFIFLWQLMRKFSVKRPGVTFFTYITAYSLVRFFIESIRLDSALNIHGIAVAKIVSLIMFLIGAAGLLVVSRFKIFRKFLR